jgi:hypothetical protein
LAQKAFTQQNANSSFKALFEAGPWGLMLVILATQEAVREDPGSKPAPPNICETPSQPMAGCIPVYLSSQLHREAQLGGL